MHKLINTIVTAALLVAASIASASDNAPRQGYTVIDKIYTVDEAKNIRLYKYLSEKGVSTEELDQPNAFVQSYTDVSVVWRKHAFQHDTYLPAALRADVELGTIIVSNRHDRYPVTNGVIPRDHTSSYACIENHPGIFVSINDCIENIETATILKQE
jgi:hypothetical protein